MGFEPTTSSMPSRRAPNCATAPPGCNFLMLSLEDSTRLGADCHCFRSSCLRNEFEKRGVREDGDERRGQRGIVDFRRDKSCMERNLDGGLPGIREGTDYARPDEKFSHHDQSNKQSEHPPTGEPGTRVNEHAHSDKKQGDERIADGERLLRHLVRELRAAEQKSCEKSAEGQRQTNCFGDGGDRQANRKREQQRDFIVASFRD